MRLLMTLLLSLLLVACTITPEDIQGTMQITDASTPVEYARAKNGFIGYVSVDQVRYGLITSSARERYNNLIDKYGAAFKSTYSINVAKDAGIKAYKDVYGNDLFIIDKEHLTYFGLLARMSRNRK